MAPGARHAVLMLSDTHLSILAGRLVEVAGVEAVTLGGSRARGDHVATSDVDLGLYYRPPLDIVALSGLARQVAGPDARVSAPGEWGPWVDGGAWLSIDGIAVDWIYRDLDRVQHSWAEARHGRFSWHFQTGHPLGLPSFAYAGEAALAVVLADPSGELTTVCRSAARYPPLLRNAVIDSLWEAGFVIDGARKGAARSDSAYVAGCLFRAVLLCAHALHAWAGRWLVNEKGAVAAVGRLPGAPSGFAEHVDRIFAAFTGDTDALRAALDMAEQLVERTGRVCTNG